MAYDDQTKETNHNLLYDDHVFLSMKWQHCFIADIQSWFGLPEVRVLVSLVPVPVGIPVCIDFNRA